MHEQKAAEITEIGFAAPIVISLLRDLCGLLLRSLLGGEAGTPCTPWPPCEALFCWFTETLFLFFAFLGGRVRFSLSSAAVGGERRTKCVNRRPQRSQRFASPAPIMVSLLCNLRSLPLRNPLVRFLNRMPRPASVGRKFIRAPARTCLSRLGPGNFIVRLERVFAEGSMKFWPYQIRAGATLRGNPFNLPGRALITLAVVNAAENTKTEGSGRDFSRRIVPACFVLLSVKNVVFLRGFTKS